MMYYSLILAGICVVCFVLQLMIPGFTDSFLLVSADIWSRPWILVTSVFLHGSVVHLFYNMFALIIFGTILENIIKRKKFLIVFFVAGVLASFGSSFMYNLALGASGAIFGLLGMLAVLRPRMRVWVSYIPMPMIATSLMTFIFPCCR